MKLHFCGVGNVDHDFMAHFNTSLNATAYLSIVEDHLYPFMATIYPFSNGYFQQDNTPCHKVRDI